MRATGPTTRPTLSFNQLRTHSLNVLLSRFRFLDRGSPANPLITRERRQVVPCITCRLAGSKRFPQIGWHLVHHARGEPFFRHGSLRGDYRHRQLSDHGETGLWAGLAAVSQTCTRRYRYPETFRLRRSTADDRPLKAGISVRVRAKAPRLAGVAGMGRHG